MSGTAVDGARYTIDMCWRFLLLLTVFIGYSLLPDLAWADTSYAPSDNAIQQVFCNVVTILTGTTGKAIATVAIIAVGVGALLGKISWGMSLVVALGVALIFGAASIVTALGGSGSTCSYLQISSATAGVYTP